MIESKNGNILKSEAEAIVNTVNCVGVMGKGIALQYKKAYPENYKAYEKACRAKQVVPGVMHIFETGSLVNPKYIVNFPTKNHWRERSRYEYVETGLKSLIQDIIKFQIKSIAIPPLGCGLGGLEWKKVKNMIIQEFSALPDVNVFLYDPDGSPSVSDMPVGTSTPSMTVARALFIKLMQIYSKYAYRLTLLEIQKLSYFLQESGQHLRLNFVKHIYGPYAHNLNKVLELLEGHYIHGYGDTQKPDVEIQLLPDAVKVADDYLESHPDEKDRIEKIASLVDGFETPYGMELLASVHWVVAHDQMAADNTDIVIASIKDWNDRKARIFKDKHICIALERLKSEGWLNKPVIP